MNELLEALRNFPKENERKENVFNILNELLFNFGSFLNDQKAKLERVKINEKDCIKYSDSYGEHIQSIDGDDPKALFFDVFKVLLKYNKEMSDGYEYFIKPYFEEKEYK